jgi:GGDEF domain-containing protein
MDQLAGLGSREDLSAWLTAAGREGVLGIYLNFDGFIGVNALFGHKAKLGDSEMH